MAVITVSRGSFSGGKMLAECLAKRLQYRCVDREVIVERAAARGVTQEELIEALTKPPGFLDRFRHRKYLYLTLIQAALSEEVMDGRAVYHGNAGHLLLRGAGPVFRLRIVAPIEFRVRMCVERLRMNEGEALAYIRKVDEDRRRWTQYLYGVDWNDPSLYDLVINLEHINIEKACALVAYAIREQECFKFGPSCQQAMRNLALASRVKAALALADATSHLEFEVTADGGTVRLKGKINRLDLVPVIREIAAGVQGVSEVDLEELASATPH